MSDDRDDPVVQPPDSFTVDHKEPRPVLYTADGKPLVKDKRIGFRVPRD